MRTTAMALIVSLLMLSTSAFAQQPSDWRRVAQAIELGSKVKIQLTGGKRLNGTLVRADETSVMVKKNTRRPEPAVTIPLDRIARLERDPGGMNFGKALAIAGVTGAGIMITLYVLAMRID